jgi:hypothetical protein
MASRHGEHYLAKIKQACRHLEDHAIRQCQKESSILLCRTQTCVSNEYTLGLNDKMLEQLIVQVVVRRPTVDTSLCLIKQLGRHHVTLCQLPPPWRQRNRTSLAIARGPQPTQKARVEQRPLTTSRTEIRRDRPRRLNRDSLKSLRVTSTWGSNRASPLKSGTQNRRQHLNVQRHGRANAQIVETTTDQTRGCLTTP